MPPILFIPRIPYIPGLRAALWQDGRLAQMKISFWYSCVNIKKISSEGLKKKVSGVMAFFWNEYYLDNIQIIKNRPKAVK